MTATETLASLTSPSPPVFPRKGGLPGAQWCYVFCFTRETRGPSQAQATLCFARRSLYAINGLDSAPRSPSCLLRLHRDHHGVLARAHPGPNASSSSWIWSVRGALGERPCLALTMFVGDHVVPHRRVVIMGTTLPALPFQRLRQRIINIIKHGTRRATVDVWTRLS